MLGGLSASLVVAMKIPQLQHVAQSKRLVPVHVRQQQSMAAPEITGVCSAYPENYMKENNEFGIKDAI
jgi:hypothetical protein